MNVLFLTIGRFESIEARSIYTDLLREFRNHGHKVFVVSQREKRFELPTEVIQEDGATILKVRIGNITKCGIIEKGISTILIEHQYKKAIKEYFPGVKFDLVLYSTPPITLVGVVEYIKKRDNAKTYLMLKDIFPQNAVDLGMMQKNGIKGILYHFFRNMEKKLYAVSDYIGCMSEANMEYVIEHNPEIAKKHVEVCPNSIDPLDISLLDFEKVQMREKYGIPQDKKIFVYGGNLGKPQGIPFLIECMREQKNKDAFFLIVGDGTEYQKLENFVKKEKPENVRLMKRLPKEDYDRMIAACDVGMIFLAHQFTIPNFPSRLLSYMQARLPVLAVTDSNTDIGKVITEGGFGWWCESKETDEFIKTIGDILSCSTDDIMKCKKNAESFLKNNYLASHTYDIITEAIRFQ